MYWRPLFPKIWIIICNIKNIIETNHPEKKYKRIALRIDRFWINFDTLLTDAVVKSDEFNALIIWKAFENLTIKTSQVMREFLIALTHQYASKFVIDRYVSKKMTVNIILYGTVFFVD